MRNQARLPCGQIPEVHSQHHLNTGQRPRQYPRRDSSGARGGNSGGPPELPMISGSIREDWCLWFFRSGGQNSLKFSDPLSRYWTVARIGRSVQQSHVERACDGPRQTAFGELRLATHRRSYTIIHHLCSGSSPLLPLLFFGVCAGQRRPKPCPSRGIPEKKRRNRRRRPPKRKGRPSEKRETADRALFRRLNQADSDVAEADLSVVALKCDIAGV